MAGYLHKSISPRYICVCHSILGDFPLSFPLPAPQSEPPVRTIRTMHQRFTVVPFLVIHLVLAALEYDDSAIQYAILALRELMSWALPSEAIIILDHEIDGAHGDLIEAAEAGRLGRDVSRALWDMFYGRFVSCFARRDQAYKQISMDRRLGDAAL
ncbi:hypothetical protein F5146DRAFT_1050714 [Armillaria mellea]|nr:hypothetical protein F5146DRAFT_1050714 [Armillaria mellea]